MTTARQSVPETTAAVSAALLPYPARDPDKVSDACGYMHAAHATSPARQMDGIRVSLDFVLIPCSLLMDFAQAVWQFPEYFLLLYGIPIDFLVLLW